MRRIRAVARSMFAAALLLVSVPTATVAQENLCGKPKGTPDEMYERLAKVEKLREMRRSELYVALEDGNDGTLWTFTLPAHSAHPAVICRRVMERRGVLEVPTSIHCSGAEAACAKLRSDFDTLNERMVEELQKQRR